MSTTLESRLKNLFFFLHGILILLGLFLVGLFITSFFVSGSSALTSDARTQMLISSVVQNIFAFILPSIIVAKILYGKFTMQNGIRVVGYPLSYIGIALLFMIALPFMNYIADWNQNLQFPESLHSLYEKLKSLEDMNAEFGNIILNTNSVAGLINGIVIIGFLTGFGEEIFFRGTLQKLMINSNLNHHWAIWISAFLFSVIHFQFFGFVPRLLLGAWFGYLFHWTGSIWVAAAAHAINNSMVVLVNWAVAGKFFSTDFSGFNNIGSDSITTAAISLVCFLITVIACRKLYFPKPDITN